MEKVYSYPPDINWVRNYSKISDAEFIPLDRYKVRIGTFNPNTGKEDFEVMACKSKHSRATETRSVSSHS